MHRSSRVSGLVFSVLVAGLALAGCTSSDDNSNDNGGDPAGGDPHQPGDWVEAPDDFNGDFGPIVDFPIRTPGYHTLTCGTFTGDFVDVDHRCRVDYDTLHTDLYFMATPTACAQTLSEVPSTFQVYAFAKVDGEGGARQIAGTYEWGGNHHNDTLQFAIDGKTFVIWHSSMGFGGRVCAPPDCLLPCNAGATFDSCTTYSGYAVDGCDRAADGPKPPAPVVCVRVTGDGTVPPLLDQWTTQSGYPSYPLLPCLGDIGSP